VTLALASIGAFPWAQVPGYVIAQVCGAFAGGAVVWLTYLHHWEVTENPSVKLGIFCTIPQVRNYAANFLTEVIATVVLVFGVLAIGANAQDMRDLQVSTVDRVFWRHSTAADWHFGSG